MDPQCDPRVHFALAGVRNQLQGGCKVCAFDTRMQFALLCGAKVMSIDPRVHFALVCGAKVDVT